MKKTRKIKITLLLFVITLSAIFIFLNIYKRPVSVEDQLFKIDQTKNFTVIVLPDTQFYSADYPEIFCQQTQWIVDHKKELNIIFVSHMGDIVNDGSEKMYQWENASNCLRKLDGVVPYGLIPGNHDSDLPGNKDSGFDSYTRFFPVDRYIKNPWYGGFYLNNQNNFQKINVNGLDLMFINLEIEPSDQVLEWANKVIKDNPNVYTILTTHKYLPIDSKYRDNILAFSKDGNTGEEIWKKLIYQNCSIRQVWSGHYHGENKIVSSNSCGKDVDQIVQDYQARRKGGEGWLRIYLFNPSEKVVDIYTYSPYLDLFEFDKNSRFKIDFTY